MDKVSALKKRLLFKSNGHSGTYKQKGNNELKFIRTKKKENTEIIKGKKRFSKEINMVKNFLGKLIQKKKDVFYKRKDDTNNNQNKKENKILKQIGTELKNSIIVKMKINNELNFDDPKEINNTNVAINKASNILQNNKINFIEKDIDKEIINQNKSLDDISSSKLLDKNHNNLEILNESIHKEKEKAKDKSEKLRKLLKKGLVYDSFDDEEEFEDQIEKDNFYINPNSIFIIILDTIIFLSTFYYLIFNPYYISSYTKLNTTNNFPFIDILNIIMEIIFIIDFFLQFFRAYYDFDENLIKNTKKIIINYINSWFLLDLICIIPVFSLIKIYYYDLFNFEFRATCRYFCQTNNLIFLLTILKCLKILKILSRNQNKFVSLMDSFLTDIKFFNDWGSIINQIILSIIFLHVTACIHIFIGRNSYPNWILENNISEDSYSTIYLSSIYFLIATITSVGYGDISGYSRNEYIFQIFLLIIGIIAYSWLISSISNYVRESNKDLEYFLSKVKILEEIRISHPEMDTELYHKIYLYLKTLKLIHKDKDKELLLDSLPYNLKYSILYQMNKPLIEGLNFFKNFRNSSFILNAVTKLIPIIAYEGDIIIENKEIINSMIFVKQGRLSVELEIDMDEIQNKINYYISGDFIIKSEEENSDNENNKKEKNNNQMKNIELKRNNTLSLMTTFNLSNNSLDYNNNTKKPISFKKRMQLYLKKNGINDIETLNNIRKKKFKYIKLYYIRKGEQYGEIPMFLNKPSNFILRVRSPKAELLFLKKIDAIEISSNYPNIWKRANKKSFKNFANLKQLVSKELVKFCDNNGIKYDKNFKKKVVHLNSTPTKMAKKLKQFKHIKNKINNDKDDKNKNKKKINIFKKRILKNKSKKEKIDVHDDIQKNKKDNIKKNKENKENNTLEKQIKNNEIKNQTPYKEFEINDEIYNGELFIDKNSNLSSIYNNCITNASISPNLIKLGDFSTINSIKKEKEDLDISHNESQAKKNLIKLIDSSRTKTSTKLYYHKNKKERPLFKNNNYNVQYNINNSFNINNVQNNISFNSSNLTIITSESFHIKNTYTNLNSLSKGKYSTDKDFQIQVKKMFQKNYGKNKKVKLNVSSDKNLSKTKINRNKSFFQRYSKKFSGKDLNKIILQTQVKRKESFDKKNEEDKSKKIQNNKSDMMLEQITQNIIDGDKNLNNPEIFYNEMFKNIMVTSRSSLSKSKSKSKSTIKHTKINKKASNTPKSLINNEKKLNT